MSGSRPAVRARRAADEVSRRVTSSASTSSKNSACPMSRALARARRSGRVSRQRPSLTARSTVLSSGEMTGGGALTTTLAVVASEPRIAVHPVISVRAPNRENTKVGVGSGKARREQTRLDRHRIGAILGVALEHPSNEADTVGLGFGGDGHRSHRHG